MGKSSVKRKARKSRKPRGWTIERVHAEERKRVASIEAGDDLVLAARATLPPREPPPIVVDVQGETPGAAYVRVPFSPEVVAAVQEHAENAVALFAIVKRGATVPASELFALLHRATTAIERDASRLRRRPR
jgi:hypothetical protein